VPGLEGGLLIANDDHLGTGRHVSRINSGGSGGNSMHSNEATLPEASSGSHGASDQVRLWLQSACLYSMPTSITKLVSRLSSLTPANWTLAFSRMRVSRW